MRNGSVLRKQLDSDSQKMSTDPQPCRIHFLKELNKNHYSQQWIFYRFCKGKKKKIRTVFDFRSRSLQGSAKIHLFRYLCTLSKWARLIMKTLNNRFFGIYVLYTYSVHTVPLNSDSEKVYLVALISSYLCTVEFMNQFVSVVLTIQYSPVSRLHCLTLV